jgi:hypothetical protein
MQTLPNPAGDDGRPTALPESYTALTDADERIGVASVFLAEWHAQRTGIERSYVAAGHECIDAIDAALRALNQARSALITELRRDEDERFVRVDAMLAESRAARGVTP